MRNFVVTLVICGLVLGVGFYITNHFAPVPALERQLPKIDPSFQRLVHLTSHESKDIAFYTTRQGWLGVALLDPAVSKEARQYGSTELPSRHGASTNTRTFDSSDDYFVYGMIGNPSITQVYVDGEPCDTFPVHDVALWYCFSGSSLSPMQVEGMDEAGSIRYRSSRGAEGSFIPF